jgi:hypothetical protein
MTIRRFIFEFIGFAIFVSLAELLFNIDSLIAELGFGFVGMYLGKFASKLNGVMFQDLNSQKVISQSDDLVNYEISFSVYCKRIPTSFSGNYSASFKIEDKILSNFLYAKFDDSTYSKILKNGRASLIFKDENRTIEITLTE